METNLPSFDKAEYSPAADDKRCTRCRQNLPSGFFLLNGELICESCAKSAIAAPAEAGDVAFAKAILFGFAAAVLGSILYALVEIGTGWTIGYVALAVGWMVGKAMKYGSSGRGGRRYQLVAALLTYLSVSGAGLLVILHAVKKQNPGGRIALGEQFDVFVLKYSLLSPFLELRNGLGGIIGLFILFIGVRAAWSLTGGSEYRITGPHNVAEAPVAL